MNSGKSATAIRKKSEGWTAEEKAAMRERPKEMKAEACANRDRAAEKLQCR